MDNFPKRIILSRKGWDSKAGGKPSPIFPDGSHVSFPIPDGESGIRYGDVCNGAGESIGSIVEQLARGKIVRNHEVHLDPDLEPYSVRRANGFIAAFGQCGGAQTHLWNEGVRRGIAEKDGDLFLFFGLYRPVLCKNESWSYVGKQREFHKIFGWLQVGEVIELAKEKAPKEVTNHPHVRRSAIVRNELGGRREDNNTLYLARPTLSFAPDIPGAGVFGPFDPNDFGDPRRLTFEDNNCSQWKLPSFFCGISNMGTQPEPVNGWWCPQRRGPGQEFVLNTAGFEREAARWLLNLFKHAQRQFSARA